MAVPDQAARDRATDIRRSVIVQAPAGSGKTSLLVTRFLKLLAVVDEPEEVLAITFTRKAASEMATRVLDALERAASAQRSAGTNADAARVLARSGARGWRLMEQPARLKIQTIDSLALGLVRGLPVAAGLDPTLALTETAEGLYRAAAARHLLRLYEEGPLAAEIADFLDQCGNDAGRAERLLAGMLGRRDQWLEVIHSVVAAHQRAPEQVSAVLEVAVRALNDTVIHGFRDSVGEGRWQELQALVDHAAAELGQSPVDIHTRCRLAAEILTTRRGEFRRRLDRRQGFGPNDADAKARVMALIQTLAENDLAEQVANLRYLPDPHLSAEAVRRLVNVSINLALANAELTDTFRSTGTTDFTTLILNAQAALGDAEAPTELALALDYRIHHLLVDEFQDTSVSQFRLFERLMHGWSANDGNTFFAVGDPMQSIYRFRDADVSLFHRAWRQGIAHVPLDPVVLTSNFRSDARLVRWINGSFEHVLGGREDPVLGRIAYRAATPTLDVGGGGAAVTLYRYATPSDQVEGVAGRIRQLLQDTEDSVALLVRNRGHLTALIRTLRDRGISWHANDIDPLLNKPVVRDLLSLVAVLADDRDRLAWFSVLRAPFVGLSLADLQRLADTDHFPARLAAADPPGSLSSSGAARFTRLARAWRHAAARLHEVPPRSVVETFWLRLGGADAYADPAALDHACRLLELLDALGPAALSVEALEQAATNLFATDLTESRLQILTVHKAKGLEFDHVLLPFLERTPRSDEAELLLWRALPEGLLMGVRDDEGPYPWLARENRFRDRYERQRLFYVACTRARRSLTLFAAHQERPPEASMLALLEGVLDSGVRTEMQIVDVPAAPADHPLQRDLFDVGDESGPPRLIRLVDEYRWAPPAIPSPAVTPEPFNARTEDPLAAREEVVLGLVVHAALERLTAGPLPVDVSAWVTAQQPLWRRQAVRHGLADPEASMRVAEKTARQLDRVLRDPEGRRLLSARESAHAEFAVTTVGEDTTENLIIDRIFVEDGIRWVVDYKTSIPPAGVDVDAFLAGELVRYQGQLRRYGDAVAALFGDAPRLAIYFTAVPRLCPLTS